MAKPLSDILRGTNRSRIRPGRTGERPGVDYASRMKDERNFVASHDTEEFDDRVGNGSDVYSATNIKKSQDSRHGHIPKPEDERQYRINNEELSSTAVETSPRPRKRPVISSPVPPARPVSVGVGGSTEISPSGMPDASTRGFREETHDQPAEVKEMMVRQLHFVKYAADEIMDYLKGVNDYEGWFQNKLTGLHDQIRDLHSYIEGDKRLRDNESDVRQESIGDPRVQPKDTKSGGNRLLTDRKNRLSESSSSVKWSEFPTQELANHAENAIRHDFHAHDAFGHVYSMAETPEHKEWLKNNRSRIINMFGKYGLQTESNDGSRTRTATEQARARFDKKMERQEVRKEREDDN
jgi:hypothetical protein